MIALRLDLSSLEARQLRSMAGIMFASVFATAASAITAANAAEVTGARITGMGVYRCDNTVGSKPAPGTPGNDVDLSEGCQLALATSTIVAKIGTRFGCTYVLDGSPLSAEISTSIRWVFPPRGLNDPSAGKVHFWADYTVENQIGQTNEFRYQFEEPWELVLGVWTMEIRHGSRKLAECRFDVVAP